MQPIIAELYFYAQEEHVQRYLWTAEYQRAIFNIEEGWETFRATLTKEQGERLDALLLQREKITNLEDEATFCCALSIGISLGRL